MRPSFMSIAGCGLLAWSCLAWSCLAWSCLAEEPKPAPTEPVVPAPVASPAVAPVAQPPVGVVMPPPAAGQPNRPGSNRPNAGAAEARMRRQQQQNGGMDANNPNRPNRPFANNNEQRADGRNAAGNFGEGLAPLLRGNPAETAARALGIDWGDLRDKQAKVDMLPLGESRRQVLNVPVGGVDLPGGTGQGWKMEQIFKLNDEQQKSLSALREEYAAEQKKLEAEIAIQQKALAAKAAALRFQYEEKANGLLAGADKDAKAKMDAIARESHAQTEKVQRDAVTLYDPADTQQGLALVRMIREKSLEISREAENKLLPLLPAESKERVEEAVRNNAEARDQINRMLNINTDRNVEKKKDKAERKAMKDKEKGEAPAEMEKAAPANF